MARVKKGAFGIFIIGIIFTISGLGYFSDIINYSADIDWEEFCAQKKDAYLIRAPYLLQKQDQELQKQGVLEFIRSEQYEQLSSNIQSGQKIIHRYCNKVRDLHNTYLLMQHPKKLFMLILVSLWLIVVGLGCTILFPWSRRFVGLTIFTSYCWRVYSFVFDRSINKLWQDCENEINDFLGIPFDLGFSSAFNDQFIFLMLRTLIFLAVILYLNSSEGKKFFQKTK